MKRIVISLMLLGIVLPFILLTDLYPFFRFGMFAEPVKQEVQTEQFILQGIGHNGRRYTLEPREVGLSGLNYLLRNYYYRNQTEQLLQNIHRLYPDKNNIRQWQLLRITSPVDYFRPDTVVVGNLNIKNAENVGTE